MKNVYKAPSSCPTMFILSYLYLAFVTVLMHLYVLPVLDAAYHINNNENPGTFHIDFNATQIIFDEDNEIISTGDFNILEFQKTTFKDMDDWEHFAIFKAPYILLAIVLFLQLLTKYSDPGI